MDPLQYPRRFLKLNEAASGDNPAIGGVSRSMLMMYISPALPICPILSVV